MSKLKQQFGQYMTPSLITSLMTGLITHKKTDAVLEPSCGDGAFLSQLKEQGFTNITACELDPKIINPDFEVINSSFITYPLENKFHVIIGNPPYIRWKNLEKNLKDELQNCDLWNKYCNSLCDYSTIFIIKSIQHLTDDGELIFITPEYWLSTTHAQNLRNYIAQNGIITHIYRFNETPIFKGVTGSFIIFRFVKTKTRNSKIQVINWNNKTKFTEEKLQQIKNLQNVQFFEIPQFKQNQVWILTDSETQKQIINFENICTLPGNSKYELLGDYCHIGNGMVSGLDKAFQLEDDLALNENEKKNTIKVLKAKDIQQYFGKKMVRYIFIKEQISLSLLSQSYPAFFQQLSSYKDRLEKRYDYHHPLMFWNWAFLRNYNLFSSDQDKIFVPCKERITNKSNFRFCFAPKDVYPTQDVAAIYKKEETKENLLYILAFLNSPQVFTWLTHKGIRKGDIIEFSETPISSIPFRKIDFSNPHEVELHNNIVTAVSLYLTTHSPSHLETITSNFEKLFSR